MSQSYRGRFEFFVVATVIAIVALVALDRYNLMAKDARILRLEIISHHFIASAAHCRVQHIMSKHSVDKEALAVEKVGAPDSSTIHFSPQGWPASLKNPVTAEFEPTDSDCVDLWRAMLQNPAPIAEGEFVNTSRKYRAFAYQDSCRYALADGAAQFAYFPASGKLLFSAIKN